MRIIIIGASGLIGNHFFSLAQEEGKDVIGTYSTQPKEGLLHFDMRTESLISVFPDLGKDDVLYLLSAYSNPTWIYQNQVISRELNLIATKRVIDDTLDAGARLIFMSSVEVFDGKSGNYHEKSIPAPLNLYGHMKFEIEQYLEKKKGRICIVRTGWNVGWSVTHRCVISLTYETLMKPNAKMANDNTFSISDVQDTAKGLLKISDHESLRMCHLASEPYIVRNALATEIQSVSKHGQEMAHFVTSFSEIPYTERRAQYNHLDNSLAVSLLGISFRNSQDIIHQKVALLDEVK
jgi:dTDP-4-dehydrorhamnose reductase